MLARVRRFWMIACMSSVGVFAATSELEGGPEGDGVRIDQGHGGHGAAAWLQRVGQGEDPTGETLSSGMQPRYPDVTGLDLRLLKRAMTLSSMLLRASQKTLPYAAWLQLELQQWPDLVPGDTAELAMRASDGRPLEMPGANFYVPMLKPIFESARVPVALVWVAEVESSFNPGAISPVGAAGLYQLMPATARQYGLRLEPDDDRFYPEKNARAAARHMSYLRDVFDDWSLAMAAYNAGHNRVRGLLKQHHARSFEEIAIYLPMETQVFVPRVDATLLLREGVSLARLTDGSP